MVIHPGKAEHNRKTKKQPFNLFDMHASQVTGVRGGVNFDHNPARRWQPGWRLATNRSHECRERLSLRFRFVVGSVSLGGPEVLVVLSQRTGATTAASLTGVGP